MSQCSVKPAVPTKKKRDIRVDVTAGWGGHSELAPGDSIPDRLKIHARTWTGSNLQTRHSQACVVTDLGVMLLPSVDFQSGTSGH